MIVGSQIILHKSEIPDIDALCEYLTYPNPEYTSAIRRKAWNIDSIEPDITYAYLDKSGSYIRVPRNIPDHLYRARRYREEVSLSPVPTMGFKGDLREYQTEFFASNQVEDYPDSIYEVSCGLGKTVMALYMIAQKKQRAVIMVPTHKLIRQWYLEAKEFLTGCTIGISDKNVETTHAQYDVLIMSQDLARARGLGEDFFSTFGVSVWDELHRSGAQSYLPLIENCPTAYRIGLTATFRRNDGFQRLLMQHFGFLFTMRYKGPRATVYAMLMTDAAYSSAFKLKSPLPKKEKEALEKITRIYSGGGYIGFENTKRVLISGPPAWKKAASKFLSQPSYSSIDSLSTALVRKNRQVANLIQSLVDQGRNVLVLSKRKDILKKYYKQFKDKTPSYLVISETSKLADEDQMNKDARIIFGINQIAEYGFNVPRLDTLVLLHPISDTEQAIGRILRKREGKKSPLAIIVTDNNLYLRNIVRNAAKTFIPYNGTFKGFYPQDQLCHIILK